MKQKGREQTANQGRRPESVPNVMQYLDRLMSIEVRDPGWAGKTAELYEAARTEAGGEPLAFRAAVGLRNAVHKNDNVLIITGAGTGTYMPWGENDGPIGAAVLARVIKLGLEATPILVCEDHHKGPIIAACEAAGVELRTVGEATRARTGGALVCAPTEQKDIDGWAASLLDETSPTAIISIERLGPNAAGLVHGATGFVIGADPDPNVTGNPFAGLAVDIAPLFIEAASRAVFSIGIGDAGNEIGFGRIVDAVRQVMPYGAKCQCSCHGGMATVVPTDTLIAAGTSNWGGYALEAALCILLRRPDLPHTPDEERRIILRCTDAGGFEGQSCSRRFAVDGISGESNIALVQIFGEMVRRAIAQFDSGPVH